MSSFHPTRRRWAALLACTAALCGCGSNFHVVEPGRVYRAAQPDAHQLEHWIWRYGIETVVRLQLGGPDEEGWHDSFDPTVATGIDFVHVPMSAVRPPTREQLVRLCEVFAHARYPILIHCRAGADRTGLASAIWVLQSTGDLARARAELALLPYLHTGWFGTGSLDRVLDQYEASRERAPFCAWAREVYGAPGEVPAPGPGLSSSPRPSP